MREVSVGPRWLQENRYLERLQYWSTQTPEAPAITQCGLNGDRTLTYGEIWQEIVDFDWHLEPRTRVFIQMETAIAQAKAFLCTWRAGSVPCVLPPGQSLASLAGFANGGVWRDDEKTPIDGPSRPTDSLAGDRSAYLVFTGGATGTAKAAVFSPEAVLMQLENSRSVFGLDRHDTFVGWLPLYHNFGLFGHLLTPLWVGAHAVLISAKDWLTRPQVLFEKLHQYRGTVSAMPNFGFAHSLRAVPDECLKEIDLSPIRILGSGSEPIQAPVLRAFLEKFKGTGLEPAALNCGYGLTEYCYCCTSTRHDTFDPRTFTLDERESVSCGRPLPDTLIRIVGENGDTLPEGRVGAIEVKGDSLFSGYEGASHGGLVVKDGWLQTGDLGYLKEGELYVHGRRKELMIVGGRNYFPQDVESIVLSEMGQSAFQAAAFGLERYGTESVCVVCEVHPMDAALLQRRKAAIINRLKKELALALDDLKFVGPGWLVRSGSGKLARFACKRKYLREAQKDQNFEGLSLRAKIELLLAETLGTDSFGIDQNWIEAGLDSLEFVRVVQNIEKLAGTEIPIADFAAHPTIGRLLCLLECSSESERPIVDRSIPSENEPAPIVTTSLERLKRIWKRGPLIKGVGLPYGLGSLLLRFLATHSLTRTLFFREQVSAIQEALGRHCNPEILSKNLVANNWNHWRRDVLRKTSDHWIEFRNWSLYEEARKNEKGTLFAIHHSPHTVHLFNNLDSDREMMGIGNLRTRGLRKQGLLGLKSHPEDDSPSPQLLGAQIYQAHQVLERGGWVFMAPDHWIGRGGFEFQWLGRKRFMRPGLGEIAVRATVDVLPVFCYSELDGRIVVQFEPTLKAEGDSPAEKIHSIGRQYSILMNRRAEIIASAWPLSMWKQFATLERA